MDIGEVFRRLFGFRPRDSGDKIDSDDNFYSTEEWRNKPFERPRIFDNDQDQASRPRHPFSPIEGMFDHFQRDLFRQMEGLHRQMEDMMRGFGQIEFPPGLEAPPSETPKQPRDDVKESQVFVWSSPPSPFFHHGAEGPQRKARNPRDYMLKHDEDAENNSTSRHPPSNESSKEIKTEDPTFFPSWRNQEETKSKDSDLDGKLTNDQMLALIKSPKQSPAQRPSSERPFFSSSGRSVTFSTVTGADGKLEHKKVVRDSSGREETTVTRSMGDKSHTVTTIKGSDGVEEKRETLSNMEQGELPQFENQWNQHNGAYHQEPFDPARTQPRIDFQDRNIFSKLFGWRKQ